MDYFLQAKEVTIVIVLLHRQRNLNMFHFFIESVKTKHFSYVMEPYRDFFQVFSILVYWQNILLLLNLTSFCLFSWLQSHNNLKLVYDHYPNIRFFCNILIMLSVLLYRKWVFCHTRMEFFIFSMYHKPNMIYHIYRLVKNLCFLLSNFINIGFCSSIFLIDLDLINMRGLL